MASAPIGGAGLVFVDSPAREMGIGESRAAERWAREGWVIWAGGFGGNGSKSRRAARAISKSQSHEKSSSRADVG